MKLSTMLMYNGNPRAGADEVVELEKAGLDMVWVAEAYGYDSPTLMGYLAAKTERLQIGAGILNVFSRAPGGAGRGWAWERVARRSSRGSPGSPTTSPSAAPAR